MYTGMKYETILFIGFSLLIHDVAGQCTENSIRLVGGMIPNEGRVEICISNTWGTVCDDLWDANDATVVCRQLGYLTNDAVPFYQAHFGVGTGSVLLDNVGCSGTEIRLIDCNRAASIYCFNGNAGVRCQIETTGSVCNYGQVRLVNGSTQYEGRVEVCINNQWGTVCDDSWDTTDATTVCKQLGYAYTGYGFAYTHTAFGAGTGQIVLDSVQCLSSSSQLLECPSSPILTVSDYCDHRRVAGVGCEAPCPNGALRLVGGNILYEGRVEVCISNQWGTVCDDLWGTNDATVVCRQLGYSISDTVSFTGAHFGTGIGRIFFDNVACNGNEGRLIDCSRASSVSCYSSYGSGVRCQIQATGSVCDYGNVRLVNGSTQYEGRVEVCINNQWGTVCDNSWDTTDATTVCRQLGYAYTGYGLAYTQAAFGSGNFPIFLDAVQCSSSSSQLLECPSSPIFTISNFCDHSRVAGVQCEAPCSTGDIRLVSANIPNEGRVEICFNNVWGTVCDDLWGTNDATVVCRQLGYSTTDSVAFGSAQYGAGIGTIYLDSVNCVGNEQRLIDCRRASSVYCSRGHLEDAGVRCQLEETGSMCNYGDVRLVNGSTQYEGRVVVCINDQWGTVCDNSWDTTDATIVCKQLGYAYTGSGLAYVNTEFGIGAGKVFLQSVQCSSSSSQLLECPSSPVSSVSSFCDHTRDAGVGCEAPCTTGDIRLVGGYSPNEGRVEVCISSEWGTVCDDHWSTNDATVVCRQLEYASTGALAFGSAFFGVGIGRIFLDSVSCNGGESNLLDCSRSSSVYCSTGHFEDAGVRCQYPDPCLNAPCSPHAVCQRGNIYTDSFNCTCNSPFQGDGFSCLYPDPCTSDPCDINAYCVRDSLFNGHFHCTCRDGFVGNGHICSVPDPCLSGPCDNNAMCEREGPLSASFNCTCISPYEGNGYNCSVSDLCLISDCDTNAVCQSNSTTFTCQCNSPYEGDGLVCSYPDPCLSGPCDENADCNRISPLNGDFTCTCREGYIGDGVECSIPDPCISDPCSPHAVCQREGAHTNSFNCTCNSPFQGDGFSCLYPDPCTSDPCDVNANCVRASLFNGHFHCTCRDGFVGNGFSCSEPSTVGITNTMEVVSTRIVQTTCLSGSVEETNKDTVVVLISLNKASMEFTGDDVTTFKEVLQDSLNTYCTAFKSSCYNDQVLQRVCVTVVKVEQTGTRFAVFLYASIGSKPLPEQVTMTGIQAGIHNGIAESAGVSVVSLMTLEEFSTPSGQDSLTSSTLIGAIAGTLIAVILLLIMIIFAVIIFVRIRKAKAYTLNSQDNVHNGTLDCNNPAFSESTKDNKY